MTGGALKSFCYKKQALQQVCVPATLQFNMFFTGVLALVLRAETHSEKTCEDEDVVKDLARVEDKRDSDVIVDVWSMLCTGDAAILAQNTRKSCSNYDYIRECVLA